MTPRLPLFRKEALDARRNSHLGAISLVQPVPLVAFSGFLLTSVLVLLLYIFLGEYTTRSRVTGQLVPSNGLTSVIAPMTGVVTQLYGGEGNPVASQGKLAVITMPKNTATGIDALSSVRQMNKARRESIEEDSRAQIALLGSQQAGYEKRLSRARQELTHINNEIAARQQQLELQESILSRYQGLATQRYASSIQLEQQKQTTLSQKADIEVLWRQRLSLQSNISDTAQGLSELHARRTILAAQSRKDLSLLKQEGMLDEVGGEMLVRAPVSGVIASRLVDTGQSVQAGQTIFNLIPAGSTLQAQLLVPSRAIGFIKPGNKVFIRYQSFPYQKFGHHEGRVSRISRNALTQGELTRAGGLSNDDEPMYRVIVDIPTQTMKAYGRNEILRPGMILEADILGERRKIYEWILEPLYSISGKMI